jgi:porin
MKAICFLVSLAWALNVTSAVQAQTVSARVPESEENGPLSPLGKQLDDLGIRIRSQLVNEAAGNPTGGVHQGSTNVGQAQLGATFDLNKIVGIEGAQFYVNFVQDYGHGLSHDVTGTFTKAQEIYKNEFNLPRLGVIAYEQKLMDDRLDIFVGRLGTTSFYGRLTNDCYFQSGISCSVPQVLNSEAGFTFATSASWASNVRYWIAPDSYLQAGAFEVDPFIQQTNGFNWSINHATGVTVPFEFSKGIFDLEKERYPGNFKIGGYVSTAPFNSPFLNTRGQSIGLVGGTPQPSSELRSGFYVMGEKTVWRPSVRDAKSIALFGGWIQPIDDNDEVVSTQIYGGATLRAPLASRPHDILSFEANYYRLSDSEVDFLRDARIKAGGSGTNNPNEFAFEMDYSALLYRGIRLTPNIQYIIHPDNSAIPATKVLPKDEIVLGMKLTVNFSSTLGLPIAPSISD